MNCVKAYRIIAQDVGPAGKVSFKIPNRGYWAQNIVYGKIVNMSLNISFLDSGKNRLYSDFRKIKVRIVK
jgi:hypothetical protein